MTNEDEHHPFVRVDVEITKSVNETVSLWAVLTLIFSCNHRFIIIKSVILTLIMSIYLAIQIDIGVCKLKLSSILNNLRFFGVPEPFWFCVCCHRFITAPQQVEESECL
jgi:hypothetical protein